MHKKDSSRNPILSSLKEKYNISPEVMQKQVCTIYNMNDHVVSDRQTQAEGESFVSDTTQTQCTVSMPCETLQFYRSIGKVI